MDVEGAVAEAFAAAGGAGDDGADAPVTETAPAAEGAVETAPQSETPAADGEGDGDAAVAAEGAQDGEALAADGKPKYPGRITVDKHQRILENQRAEANQQIQALQSQVQELSWAKDPEAQAAFQALRIADANPRAFLTGLLKDERYAALVKEMFGGGAPAAAGGAPAADGKLPEPDVLLPDGSVGYSAEAMQKMLAARESAIKGEVQKLVEERTAGLTDLLNERKYTAALKQAYTEQGQVLEGARKDWPGFSDNEPAIRDAFVAHMNDPRYTLHDAYRQVVFQKFQADRDTMRKELLTEINGKAKAAVPAPGASVAATPSGPRSVADIVAEQFRAAAQ